MLVTVAICTLDRAESLRRALDSLTAMSVPHGVTWEVIVVNNGCTDHTDSVITSFARRLPIRRELELQRGLSHARNRAVDTATGEYIIWTDDDVVVDSNWLVEYVNAFRRWPESVVFGGPILPRFEPPVVKWLKACMQSFSYVYAARDFGNVSLRINSGRRIPFGANFALRALEQRRFRYDPDLGVAPGRQRLGEETKVISSILASGATGYLVPDARVEHCIGHERQTTAYVAGYFAASGETKEFLRGSHEMGPFYFGVPRWLWRHVVRSWICYRAHRLVSPAPVWMRHLKTYGLSKGRFRYWWNRKPHTT